MEDYERINEPKLTKILHDFAICLGCQYTVLGGLVHHLCIS